jgi:phage terminase large subunit-like protein
MRLSSKTQNKDGFNFKKAVHDEAHDCKDDEIAEAVLRAMSTHEDYLFKTVSTNGFINDGYYDKKLAYANAWLNGEIDNIHYVCFLFEQDDESECWGDIELLQKSNPSLIYGVKKYSFLEQSRQKAQLDKESRMHFLTKDCNIKCSNASAWLTLDEYWYDQEPFTLDRFRGRVCLGAVDLADCGDLAVAEALFMERGNDTKYVVPQFFIPESKLKDRDNGAQYEEWSRTINPVTGMPYVTVCKGNKIDQKNIADWYQSLRDRYGIETIMIGYDPWHSDIFLLWCDKKTGYGFNTMKIYQNSKLMSFPMKTVERDLHARLINYGNNPVMKYCFGNMSAKIVGDLIMPEKIDGQYSRKIDGVVALIILYATLEKNEVTFNQYLQ